LLRAIRSLYINERRRMARNTIQADYDELARMTRELDNEYDMALTLIFRIQNGLEALRAGGWVGRGARKFFDEMDHDVMPGLRRLADALETGSTAVRQIEQLVREAEEEAAHVMQASDVTVS
jgi:WXG100 family type VII secretion target